MPVEPVTLNSPAAPEISARPWYSSRRALAWVIGLLGIAFCIYRIAAFTPQPLDGPHTLRPVLNAWFEAFLRGYENPDAAYETWRFYSLLALLVPPALALLNFVSDEGLRKLPDRIGKVICSRTLFFLAIAAVLLFCRFPRLLDYQLNPDEGQFLTAAHKLFYDASFFHAADTGTSGPLNIYPLMLPAIFGVSPDYASSRIIVLAIAFSMIFLLYKSVRLFAPDSIARIAILPVAGAVAVFDDTNLIHYSSEQIPVLLISVALYLAARVISNPRIYRAALFFLGLLVPAAFFAKMQSVPIVFAIGVVTLGYVHATKSARPVWCPALLFSGGAALLLFLNIAICLADGVLTNFWISYIVGNRRYADVGTNFVTELPSFLGFLMRSPEVSYLLLLLLALAAIVLVQRLRADGQSESMRLFHLAAVSAIVIGLAMSFWLRADVWNVFSYVALIALFGAPVCFLLFFGNQRFSIDSVRWFGLLSAVATGVALFSVYKPHRPFPHYLYLLFPPVAALIAWIMLRQNANPRARLAFPLLVIVLSLANSTYLWGARDPHKFHTIAATIRGPEGDFIRSLTSPNGQIFVWGWTADPYLSSGRVSPARDYNMFYFFGSQADLASYFRDRLMHDLSQNPPELIIDAVGPNSWYYGDRAQFGFEQFPEVNQFVNSFYVHLTDAYAERYFIRHDLAQHAASIKPKVCSPGAIRCMEMPRRFFVDAAITLVLDDLPPVQLPAQARIEADFTPMGRQFDNATVFHNEPAPNSFRGFRFQNGGGDEYQLLVGLGDHWEYSKPIVLAAGRPVSLTVEFAGNDVHLRVDGKPATDMHLPAPMANSDGKIQMGSWLGGQCRFTGTVEFFEIVAQAPPA